MTEYFHHLPARAAFAALRVTKLECFRTDRMLVGLNCFEPGQSQSVHAHAGADKVYAVVSGKATFVVGDERHQGGPGDLVVAPAGVPHGVESAAERTVVLVVIAPAPTS